MFHSERSFKDFLLGLALGGSCGAFLFNSKKGKQVQKDLMNRYHMMTKKTHHFLKEGIEKLTTHHEPVKRKSARSPSKRKKTTSRTKRKR